MRVRCAGLWLAVGCCKWLGLRLRLGCVLCRLAQRVRCEAL